MNRWMGNTWIHTGCASYSLSIHFYDDCWHAGIDMYCTLNGCLDCDDIYDGCYRSFSALCSVLYHKLPLRGS